MAWEALVLVRVRARVRARVRERRCAEMVTADVGCRGKSDSTSRPQKYEELSHCECQALTSKLETTSTRNVRLAFFTRLHSVRVLSSTWFK